MFSSYLQIFDNKKGYYLERETRKRKREGGKMGVQGGKDGGRRGERWEGRGGGPGGRREMIQIWEKCQ